MDYLGFQKTRTRDSAIARILFSPVSPLCFSWYVSFSISSHRPALGMCSPTLEAPTLWFHLPKMNPISSFDNHSKNSKAGFYLDHLGSSAKLCVNTLGSGRLRLCNTITALEGPTVGIRVVPENWNGGEGSHCRWW